MKKRVSALLISLSMLTQSYAEDYVNYVSVGFAIQDIDNPYFDDGQGTAVILNAGKNLYSDIALEFEGALSIVKPEGKIGTRKSDVDFWSLGLYGAYIWKVNNLSIKPRIGIVYENIKSTININDTANPLTPTDKGDVALSGGIGLSYQLGQNYALYSNYTKIEDDINHLTFGAEYKF